MQEYNIKLNSEELQILQEALIELYSFINTSSSKQNRIYYNKIIKTISKKIKI